MHIERLKIREFRNLKDFEIQFARAASVADTDKGEIKEFRSHAVIGQNGSGKSNLLEAIITIFRDLDLNNAASLDYEMDFALRGIPRQVLVFRSARTLFPL
jgi:predicted ATP-dependent endonuclease of OLD family